MRNRVGRAVLLVALAAGGARAAEMPFEVFSDWNYYNNAGWAALNRGKYDRAAQAFKIAIDRVKPYEATERWLLARSYADYARVLHLQKRDDEALPLARWAVAVREAATGREADPLPETLTLLAEIQSARRRNDEAAPLLARALALREKALGRDHYELIEPVEALAAVYDAQGKTAEAEALYRRSLALRETNAEERLKRAERQQLAAVVLRESAAALGVQASPFIIARYNTQAEKIETQARTLREATPESLSAAVTTQNYASLLRRAGRTDEADDLDARARAIRDAVETRAARARAGR